MKPLQSQLDVIEAAESLAQTLGKDPNYTVAAAALDTQGRIHTAVNVHHFTGGRAQSSWHWGLRQRPRRARSSPWRQPETVGVVSSRHAVVVDR